MGQTYSWEKEILYKQYNVHTDGIQVKLMRELWQTWNPIFSILMIIL